MLLDGQGADETLAGYNKYIHWYIQQLISRYKFGKRLQKKRSLRKTIPRKVGLWQLPATYLPAHAAIHLESKEYNKIIRHPDINKDLITTLRGREWEGIHKPIITKLNDIYFLILPPWDWKNCFGLPTGTAWHMEWKYVCHSCTMNW